jgi:hypothetical protein
MKGIGRGVSGVAHVPRRVEPVFLQVRAFADPVDYREKAGRRERA